MYFSRIVPYIFQIRLWILPLLLLPNTTAAPPPLPTPAYLSSPPPAFPSSPPAPPFPPAAVAITTAAAAPSLHRSFSSWSPLSSPSCSSYSPQPLLALPHAVSELPSIIPPPPATPPPLILLFLLPFFAVPSHFHSFPSSCSRVRSSSVGRARDSWSGGPAFNSRYGRHSLLVGSVSV